VKEESVKEKAVKKLNLSKDSPFNNLDLEKTKNRMNINKQICNYCYTYLNEINDNLDRFQQNYLKMQKELLDHKKDKYDVVEVIDYDYLSDLRSHINRKMFQLSSDLRVLYHSELRF